MLKTWNIEKHGVTPALQYPWGVTFLCGYMDIFQGHSQSRIPWLMLGKL